MILSIGFQYRTDEFGTDLHPVTSPNGVSSLFCKSKLSQVARVAMRTTMIVLLPPFLNNNLNFLLVDENPVNQTLRPEHAVEALNERVLPRTARFDVQRGAIPLTHPYRSLSVFQASRASTA